MNGQDTNMEILDALTVVAAELTELQKQAIAAGIPHHEFMAAINRGFADAVAMPQGMEVSA